VIRAELGHAGRFRSGKQLSRFCGLTPRNASSGQRQADAGLIPAGNRQLRSTLIEAAHRLRRCEPRWRAFAQRLEDRGKKPCVVVAAVANRWVRGLYHDLMSLCRAA
jgi:transposase